jgi:hypothetical protein
MAYTEPGVIVRTQLANAGVVIQSAEQDAVIVGELWEVFEDQLAAERYSALVGAGNQTVVWPGKKTTSIVDRAGIRTDTLEPDEQLRERATFPMVVKIQDPITGVITTLDPATDIESVTEEDFVIVEGVQGATARVNASDASAAETLKIHRRTGGFVALGIKPGDKIRVVLTNTSGPPELLGTVSSITDTDITYTTADSPTVDTASMTPVDIDAVTSPGHIISAAGGFTAGATVGDRLAIWTEAAEVDDGNGTSGNTITTAAGFAGLTAADVGRKVAIGSAVAGDGAVTASDGATNGTNTFTGTGITAAHKGRVIKIGAVYRRIVTAGTGTCTFSGATIPTATGTTFIIYAHVVRTIATVTSANQFTYSGASLAAGGQTNIPIILYTRNLRDVTVKNSDTDLSYSGAAVTSTTGFLLLLPVDLFKANISYQVYPDFRILVTYRALDVTLTGGIRVVDVDGVETLGTISEFNPLLFAAQETLLAMGTTNRELLLVGVNLWSTQTTPTGFPSDVDEVTAYTEALATIATDPGAYYLAPLTRNSAVRDAFAAHCTAQSVPEEKKERACYLTYALPLGVVESTTGGIEPGLDGDTGGNKKILDTGKGFISVFGITPGTKVVVTEPAVFAGTYETDAATTDDILVLTGAVWTGETVVTATCNLDTTPGRATTAQPNAFRDVDVGDWIILGTAYRRVSAKISNTILAYAGATVSGPSVICQVLRSYLPPNEPVVYYVDPLTKGEQATALKAISQTRANFRVIHVWPDKVEYITGQDGAGNDVKKMLDSYIAAAAEAGRDSVLPPARSSTGAALPGPTGLLHSNRYFDTAQLNTIAEGGWTILVQPQTGGNVEVRHLLSTDRSSIKRQEVSVTKNVDNQAKVLRATLKPSMNDENGRKNITPAFLDMLALPIQGVFSSFASGPEPQLVAGPNGEPAYKIRRIFQDPLLIDTVLVEADTGEPIPANVIDVTLVI